MRVFLAFNNSNFKKFNLLLQNFHLCETMAPKRSEVVVIPGINFEEEAKNVFPLGSFIPRRRVNFQTLEEEGFPIKGLFDRVVWTNILKNFSLMHYGPYALLWGITRKNGVSNRGIVKGREVVISPITIVVVFGCAEESLVFDKDGEME